MSAFEKLSPHEVAQILVEAAPFLHGALPTSRFATVLAKALPFLPGWQQMDLSGEVGGDPVRRVFLHRPGQVVPTDGQAQTLYALGPTITPETVLPYARFFFAWARGPHGRFQLVEGPEDLAWISDALTTARQGVAAMLRPLTVLGRGPSGSFLLSGCFVVARSLFFVRFTVATDGVVDISHQDLFAQDLPVRDGALGDWG